MALFVYVERNRCAGRDTLPALRRASGPPIVPRRFKDSLKASMRTTWPAKDPEEAFMVTFDFSAALDDGEAISSAAVDCLLSSGKQAAEVQP